MTEEELVDNKMSIRGLKMQNSIKAIAFDAVGTLIQATPSVATAYQQAARNAGFEIDLTIIRKRFYEHFSVNGTSMDHQTNEANERARWREIVGLTLPELDRYKADMAFDELWDHFARPENWRLFDDVKNVIESIRQLNIKLCVASNFDSRLRTVWAGLNGVEQLSSHLLISSEVGFRKPGAQFYKAVAKYLKEPTKNILFVGDDLINDVKKPREFGFHALHIDRKSPPVPEESIQKLDELLQKLH